jgi:hypothetical protein
MTVKVCGDNTGNDYTGVADAQINETGGQQSINTGSSTSIYWGSPSASNRKHMLMRFDGLAALTAAFGSVTVTDAVLSIRSADAMGSTTALKLCKLLVPFVQAQATWINRATATPWTTAGGFGASDCDTAGFATGTVPTATGYFSVGGLATQVQRWLDGTDPNYGFLISADPNTLYNAITPRFATTESTTGNRPYLTVTFTAVPKISVGDLTVSNTSGTATFVVSLDTSSASSITVNYATADSTATAGVDYTSTSGTLTFAPGETSKNVVVPILP